MVGEFISTILERRCLVPAGTGRRCFHLVMDLKGSGVRYQVGDSVGVQAENNQDEVEELLRLVPGAGTEVADRKGNRALWGDFLRGKANLGTVNRKLLEIVAEKGESPFLKGLLSNREGLKEYLASYHVADFLEEFKGVKFTPEELAPLMMPLMPRFYSVASAQEVVGDEVHLLVADVHYEMRGKKRLGVASHQLCHILPLNEPVIPLFHQQAHAFALTKDLSAPIIMIGPGTGVAPYRGFMQERVRSGASKRNWLFFGEWYEKEHYFYQEEWKKLIEEGWLKVSTAFSRDQQHKVYVQHRMREEGKELFQWLEEGAYLYVCGDASQMARDVEDALLEIFETEGKMGVEESHQYLKQLRATKRYQRDVY